MMAKSYISMYFLDNIAVTKISGRDSISPLQARECLTLFDKMFLCYRMQQHTKGGYVRISISNRKL